MLYNIFQPFSFKKTTIFSLTLTIIFAQLSLISAPPPRCSVCGTAIKPGTKYFKADERTFCSRKCLDSYIESKLPRCSACNKPVRGECFKKDGKIYCSKECLSTTFPRCVVCGRHSPDGSYFNGDKRNFVCPACANGPRCCSCLLPCKDYTRLDDGRCLCTRCGQNAVFDSEDAEKVFQDIRNLMKKDLGISTDHRINFTLTDIGTLKSCSENSSPGQEQGVFIFKTSIENTVTNKGVVVKSVVKERVSSIMALYGLSRGKFIEVIAHELAHDWMQENYPDIQDLRVKEGWAEFIAAKVNVILDNPDSNLRMEHNPDPVYGDGYRFFRGLYSKGGMRAVINFLEKAGK